ncbi:MAG TPA: cysteine--tRNA ligase [Ornithinimicrobium sp.]|uniref:cysteine--tRNA ligase n=1 Tax=Ornithinimicrobium sp. TaxID=1977084 RepID=UPI002B4A31AC|nr:cysteine--tRNA ligase [Ornithinimicrobium sp.]HKJ11351.1 cysteine--tRNA ligase [Ornithinimicrobium sp.]
MSLRLYDTATREVREFEPLVPGKVGIYICGLTTQGAPHIGHLRFTVAFDILRRWMIRGHGYDVTFVRNVTDIDDKILRRSAEHGRPWWAWSYAHERETTQALDVLGVLPATYEPRATGHITEMVELVELLVDAGHAYPAADGSGDVYFDVQSWPAYGELTRQRIADMEPATDADPRGKRDPRDFALWKGVKAEEPASASWPTPYGRGRPGWHLECSAMARKYLGDTFDIHGGGVDLRFPHHENEQAQSRAAGLGFARWWMHNAWLTISGEKMSKSLGNSMIVSEITRGVRPLVLRYYLGAVHYRSTIEYGDTSLDEAQASVERIESFLTRALTATGTQAQQVCVDARESALPAAFAAALDDDLNVSEALAAVFAHVREGNRALAEGDSSRVADELRAVVAMTEVLGVNPLDEHWSQTPASSREHAVLDTMVNARLAQRDTARAARDFASADAIRDELAAAGIAIEDTPAGARWALHH